MVDLKTKNVLVAGTARNCAKHIKADILRIQSALQDFNQVHWLVIESDSKDNTLAKMNELTADIDCFRFISLGKLSKEYPLRTERIAFCRNTYLKELIENPTYQEIDFIMIVDLDGVNQLISRQAISSCFVRDDWDVCTANQEGPYFDIWALRHKQWSPNDCWRQKAFFKQYGLSDRKANFAAVFAKMLIIPKNTNWIEVDSAFGGLSIYRRRAMKTAKYIGKREDGTKICEHVTLHQQIKANGFKIFLNPALINAGYVNQTENYFILRKRVIFKIHNELKRVIMNLI